MSFQVREAVIEDLENIVELWRELSVGQMSKDPFYKGSLEFKTGYNQFRNSIESDACGLFVIESESTIQGFIEVWSEVRNFQMENDDCAYIVHCIFHNRLKTKDAILHMVAELYYAAENWAIAHGKKYLTADVFEHNKRVAAILGRAGLMPFKYRMVKKI